MPRVLIVAYGNPLRSDDGVAWHVADALEGKFPDIKILCLHQLAPEVAEEVSRVDRVIFIDAAAGGEVGDIRVEAVPDANSRNSSLSHALSPAAVVALSRDLYAATPQTFCVTMTGENFGHGESLSPAVAAALPEVVARVECLITDSLPKSKTTKGTK